jgi:adenylate cyclase
VGGKENLWKKTKIFFYDKDANQKFNFSFLEQSNLHKIFRAIKTSQPNKVPSIEQTDKQKNEK